MSGGTLGKTLTYLCFYLVKQQPTCAVTSVWLVLSKTLTYLRCDMKNGEEDEREKKSVMSTG